MDRLPVTDGDCSGWTVSDLDTVGLPFGLGSERANARGRVFEEPSRKARKYKRWDAGGVRLSLRLPEGWKPEGHPRGDANY